MISCRPYIFSIKSSKYNKKPISRSSLFLSSYRNFVLESFAGLPTAKLFSDATNSQFRVAFARHFKVSGYKANKIDLRAFLFSLYGAKYRKKWPQKVAR